jgi:hypothetical protein
MKEIVARFAMNERPEIDVMLGSICLRQGGIHERLPNLKNDVPIET